MTITIETFIDNVDYKEGYDYCGFLFIECFMRIKLPLQKNSFDLTVLASRSVDGEPLPFGCHHHYTVDSLTAAQKKIKAQAYDKCIELLKEQLELYIRMLYVQRKKNMNYFIVKTEYIESCSGDGVAVECNATLIRMPGFDIYGLHRTAKMPLPGPSLSWLYSAAYNQVVHTLKPLIDEYIIQLDNLALTLRGE